MINLDYLLSLQVDNQTILGEIQFWTYRMSCLFNFSYTVIILQLLSSYTALEEQAGYLPICQAMRRLSINFKINLVFQLPTIWLHVQLKFKGWQIVSLSK